MRACFGSPVGLGKMITSLGVAASLLLAIAAPSEAANTSYGYKDSGGFRNVLPPGQTGLYTKANAQGAPLSPWFSNQQPLYENLLYASPGLTDGQIASYFKDATFGIRSADIASKIRPRKGLLIIRDEQYGVPRIYGKTRAATMFGAGYAGAEDRLFLMDVLRHAGLAKRSSFLGALPSLDANKAADAEQWATAAYTKKDLQRQITYLKRNAGKSGRRAASDLRSYVAGINAYIAKANRGEGRPYEYEALFGADYEIEPWKQTDVIATASLIGGIFGRGGGGEVASAQTLNTLVADLGEAAGRNAWTGFRSKNDPEAPVTTSRRYPYQTASPFSNRGGSLAIPDTGSVEPAIARSNADDGPNGLRLASAIRDGANMSNWELVSADHTTTGHPLAVMGPQVGYYNPQILVEQELHGPGIQSRGASFAGVNLVTQLGRGVDYAWSATSASADNVDTFAEVLCGGSRTKYRYKGKCRNMERLVRNNGGGWGSQQLVTYRTVHGLVQSYGKVRGKPVAFASARSTYMHEADSILGFARLNDPGFVKNARSFMQAARKVNFSFNWAYADSRDIAYFLSGAYPIRAKGTSPDFPVLGTGKFDWKGFNPKRYTMKTLPFEKHPKALNPRKLVSWNNKQAPGFAAADNNWSFGPLFRSQLIADDIDKKIAGGGKISAAGLVNAMEEAATKDIRGEKLVPILEEAIGYPTGNSSIDDAMAKLIQWHEDGSHRRDISPRDDVYDDDDAVKIMDKWFPHIIEEIFEPTLNQDSMNAVAGMQQVDDGSWTPSGGYGRGPHAPAFSDGWWGYVHRDLRKVFGIGPEVPAESWPTTFCGGGNPTACRTDIRTSLTESLTVPDATQYGYGACSSDPQPYCYDLNRTQNLSFPAFSGQVTTEFPFQNRPTFQQVVSTRKRVKR